MVNSTNFFIGELSVLKEHDIKHTMDTMHLDRVQAIHHLQSRADAVRLYNRHQRARIAENERIRRLNKE